MMFNVTSTNSCLYRISKVHVGLSPQYPPRAIKGRDVAGTEVLRENHDFEICFFSCIDVLDGDICRHVLHLLYVVNNAL